MAYRSVLAGVVMMGLAATTLAEQRTEGLYSADRLMDADVHLLHENQILGEVEDLLFGDDMTLQAIVVEIEDDNSFGLSEEGYVIQRGDFTVETSADTDLDDLNYNVIVNLDREALKQQSTWNNDWWQSAREQASQTWQKTSKAASSAWQDTRQATSNLLQQAGEALEQ